MNIDVICTPVEKRVKGIILNCGFLNFHSSFSPISIDCLILSRNVKITKFKLLKLNMCYFQILVVYNLLTIIDINVVCLLFSQIFYLQMYCLYETGFPGDKPQPSLWRGRYSTS